MRAWQRAVALVRARDGAPLRTAIGGVGRQLSSAIEEQSKRPLPRQSVRLARRVSIGVIGGIVLVAGVIMVPYPGPGWLVVFAGLAILAREFIWAERVLKFAKHYYDQWLAWLSRQHLAVRLVVLALTGMVVLVTLWLLNVFGTVGGLFGVERVWLSSPLW